MRRTFPAACSIALAALLAGPAVAGPADTKVGETRIAYAKTGTVIRAEAAPPANPVSTLPPGTQVRVLCVTLPWVKVSATVGGQPVEGWLRAFEAIEPEALAKPAEAPAVTDASAANVSGRDVSAAGRQFDGDTERRYRASRAELAQAYVQVDAMERATAQMDPYEAIAFVMDGDLGRRGNDCALPGRLPAEPVPADSGGGHRGPSRPGGLGKNLPGPLGKHAKEIETGMKIFKGAAALKHFSEQMSPARPFATQQEYYLGRAVAANAIAKYGIDRDEKRRAYVRRVGDALVRVADPARVPPNYGGYHFDVLDSDDVNGISGPGGFVLVTRGAVAACQTEDELAAILGHELGHVALKHGERVIKGNEQFQRRGKAFADLIGAVADAADARIPGQVLDLFTAGVDAAVNTSVSHSWDRGLESEADVFSIYASYDAFYDWSALPTFLVRYGASGKSEASRSHATPAERAAALQPIVGPYGPFNGRPGALEFRKNRFLTSLGRTQ